MAYPPSASRNFNELGIRELFPSRSVSFMEIKIQKQKFSSGGHQTKEKDLIVDPPLYVYNKDGSYSKEMNQIYDSFNCIDRTHHIGEK
ncbi:MAG: hypothetical protein Ct9H300mP23_10060 [Nitrospinota bacterium]|nr:MAG: hypothetical protein Ct9H300mP23_10060 [Nitrospinota bacterium]